MPDLNPDLNNIGNSYSSSVPSFTSNAHHSSGLPSLKKTEEMAKNRFNLKDNFLTTIHFIAEPVIKLFRGEYRITEFFLKLFKSPLISYSNAKLKEKQWKVAQKLEIDNFIGGVRQDIHLLQVDYGHYGQTKTIKTSSKTTSSIAKELLKDINSDGSRQELKSVDYVNQQGMKQTVEVPSQYFVDGSRATYQIEDEIIFDTDHHLSQESGEKQFHQSIEKILDKVGQNEVMFRNIIFLLNQTALTSLSPYVQFQLSEKINEFHMGIPISNEGTVYQRIQLKNDEYILTSTSTLKLLNPIDPDPNSKNSLDFQAVIGYVAIRQQVIIPTEELSQDWREVPVENISPRLKTINMISKFSVNKEEVQKDLEEKQALVMSSDSLFSRKKE
jgi:hypothetical protein